MKLRQLLFWPHLVAGVLAGAIILIMSVTGVLLTYEKQLVAWADGAVTVPPGAQRMPADALVAAVVRNTGASPTSLTISADPERWVLASVQQKTLRIDPYSGALAGESAPGTRRFFRSVTDWHRWLAMGGDSRPLGRSLTGWANVLFLFLTLSGLYLWMPRRWNWQHLRPVLWFRRAAAPKARDFNWHNVIGLWCAIPLALVIASAMPISFPWASASLYRLVGENPPVPVPRRDTPVGSERQAAAPVAAPDPELAQAWARAVQQVDGWRTITVRLPAGPAAPYTFTIDRGGAGQPQYRGTLSVARDGVTRWEPFESQSLGRRLRSISRFLHTGEVLGLAGQTVAGVVTLGGVFLVWTGLSLTLRRFGAWKARRRTTEPARERQAA